MHLLFNIPTLAFALFLFPFRSLPPIWGIAAVALLTAVFILLVYRFASNQEAIRREKKRIQGHFLGIYLFKDSARQIFLSLARLLLAIVRYLAWSLPSLFIVIIPILLVCLQLDLHYGRRGLQVGESVNVYVRWSGATDPQAALRSASGLIVETPPVRIAALGETDWRIGMKQPRYHLLALAIGKNSTTFPVVSGDGIRPIYPERGRPGWRSYLLSPGQNYLPEDYPVSSVRIDYPVRRIDVLGRQLHWAIVYFVLAVVFGFLLKRPLKVEF
jgi:hypothetical protein